MNFKEKEGFGRLGEQLKLYGYEWSLGISILFHTILVSHASELIVYDTVHKDCGSKKIQYNVIE